MSSDPGTQKWTATSVHLSRGDVLGVTAGGVVNIDGPVFEIGTSALTTATASGRLYLGVNDGDFPGNPGSWTVNIKIGGLPPAA